MIYPKLKTVFCHIPKTGGSSLEYWMGRLVEPEQFQLMKLEDKGKQNMKFLNWMYNKYHLNNIGNPEPKEHVGVHRGIHRPVIMYQDYLGDDWYNWYSFAIIRNPFSQIKSNYKMNKNFAKDGYPTFEEFVMNDKGISAVQQSVYFDQIGFISDRSRNIIVKELFPFEYFKPIMKAIGAKFGFRPDFDVKFWSTNPDTDYTPEMIERVMDLYSDSYNLWKKVKQVWEYTKKPWKNPNVK